MRRHKRQKWQTERIFDDIKKTKVPWYYIPHKQISVNTWKSIIFMERWHVRVLLHSTSSMHVCLCGWLVFFIHKQDVEEAILQIWTKSFLFRAMSTKGRIIYIIMNFPANNGRRSMIIFCFTAFVSDKVFILIFSRGFNQWLRMPALRLCEFKSPESEVSFNHKFFFSKQYG